jgi:hypothetical protein
LAQVARRVTRLLERRGRLEQHARPRTRSRRSRALRCKRAYPYHRASPVGHLPCRPMRRA